jgi:hypothetical protein
MVAGGHGASDAERLTPGTDVHIVGGRVGGAEVRGFRSSHAAGCIVFGVPSAV